MGVCYPLSHSHLSTAHNIPGSLSVTVSREQELRLKLENATNMGFVWWQKEPVVRDETWYKATVTEDKILKIPFSQLNGSGLYSIASTKSDPVKTFGTFTVIVRGGSFDICIL